jgi:hypothetical protein
VELDGDKHLSTQAFAKELCDIHARFGCSAYYCRRSTARAPDAVRLHNRTVNNMISLILKVKSSRKVKITAAEYAKEEAHIRPQPQWVQKMAKLVDRAAKPTLMGPGSKNPSYRAGAELGHQVALHAHIRDGGIISNEICDGDDRKAQLESFRRIAPSQIKQHIEQVVKAGEMPLPEMAAYFRGFARALERGSVTKDGRPIGWGEGTRTYWVMVKYWPDVERLRTVSELHKWLCVKVGAHEARSLSRVQQICQRFKIKLRPPGRPQKIRQGRRSS